MTARANPVADPAIGNNLRGIFGALERLGYDVDALIAPFGITRAEVEDKDACIAGQICEAVLAKAMQARRVRNLPLRLAQQMPLGANPLLDYLVASSETVGDGLERLARFIHLVSPAAALDLHVAEDPIRIVIAAPPDPFRVELTTALTMLRLSRETGGKFRVVRVCLRHEPEDTAEFARTLGCPVETGSPWNGLELTREHWELPLRHCDPVLRQWLEDKAVKILARQPAQTGSALAVRGILATRMAGGDISIQAVARRLATTPRTLQRRLAAEGVSYDTLRDLTRREAAETYLADTSLSISEVAFLLGYSEPGAFHRAFKRWYKTTPQAFRHQE